MCPRLVACRLVIAKECLGYLCEHTVLGIDDFAVEVHNPADLLQVDPGSLEFCPDVADNRGFPVPVLP